MMMIEYMNLKELSTKFLEASRTSTEVEALMAPLLQLPVKLAALLASGGLVRPECTQCDHGSDGDAAVFSFASGYASLHPHWR